LRKRCHLIVALVCPMQTPTFIWERCLSPFVLTFSLLICVCRTPPFFMSVCSCRAHSLWVDEWVRSNACFLTALCFPKYQSRVPLHKVLCEPELDAHRLANVSQGFQQTLGQVNPMASFAPSSQIARAAEYWASYLPPRSPLVNSAETAGEMVEVYWMYVRFYFLFWRCFCP
jgi:hypothetical protein